MIVVSPLLPPDGAAITVEPGRGDRGQQAPGVATAVLTGNAGGSLSTRDQAQIQEVNTNTSINILPAEF